MISNSSEEREIFRRRRRAEAGAFLRASPVRKWVRTNADGLEVDRSLPYEQLQQFLNLANILHWQAADVYLRDTLGPSRLALLTCRELPGVQENPELRQAINNKIDAMCASEPLDIVVEPVDKPSCSHIAIGTGTRGRGLFASDDIPALTDIMVIPRNELLNIYVALADEIFRPSAIELIKDCLSEEGVLITYVAYLRGVGRRTNSIPHPALAYAPLEVSSYMSLITWPREAVELLQSPQVSGAVDAEHEALLELNSAIQNLTNSIPFTLEDLLWATCVVRSRSFLCLIPQKASAISVEISGRVTTLAPVADLLNHSYTGQVATPKFDVRKDSLVIRTIANVQKGCELLLNYGPLQSWEELLNYGFISRPNVFNSIQLDLELEVAPFDKRIESEAIYDHPNSPCIALESLAKLLGERGAREVLEETLDAVKPDEDVPHALFDCTEYGRLARQYRLSQRKLIEANEVRLRNPPKTIQKASEPFL